MTEVGGIPRRNAADLPAKNLAGLVLFHPEPNHINAQPNKLFEYMSAGLPVIASHFPMWRRIVEDYDCGLCVNPQDPQAIAAAMIMLATHPERARLMGMNGRSAVMAKFNWEQEQQVLLDVYSRCGTND